MSKLRPATTVWQPLFSIMIVSLVTCSITSVSALAEDATAVAEPKSVTAVMKPYKEEVSGTEIVFEMVPIPGGEFEMGSPDSEADRTEDEGPVHKVKIAPFWMGKYEVTWDEYDIWSLSLDIQRRELAGLDPTDFDKKADAVSRPTKAYTDMTFGMGHDGFPAICMTQMAAKMYCDWLSAKTGHFYRLPTEAEWEYACRAGTTTAYSFGDSVDDLDDYAWHYENADDGYHKVGLKKPNPWGLFDMHGNVAEWTLDQHVPDFYSKTNAGEVAANPFAVPATLYPRVARGGSWDDDPDRLRSAARIPSTPEWKSLDPQLPKSVWYHTDALHVGFRIVRPLHVPERKELEERRMVPLLEETVRK